jgi:hypothetical protein
MRRRVEFWNNLVELEEAHQAKGRRLLRAGAGPGGVAQSAHGTLPALAALESARRDAVREASRTSGLLGDNSDDVRLAYERARTRGELRFHAWRRVDGKLLLRFRDGLEWPDLFDQGNRGFQLAPACADVSMDGNRGSRRLASRMAFRMRVGSGPRREPVWIEGIAVVHRPVERGACIKSVSLVCSRVATHYRWKLLMTVELPERPSRRKAAVGGAVAIDLGWRQVPQGLRAATWQDSRGNWGTLVLPSAWVEQMKRLETIQSLRRRQFENTARLLQSWLEGLPAVPRWLSDEALRGPSLTTTSRLAGLAMHWRNNRFEGDDSGYSEAEAWRKQDKLLYEQLCNLRDKLQRRRREQYRIFAARMAQAYEECRLAATNLGRVARNKGSSFAGSRHNRFLVAPSTLRLALENACKRERRTIVSIQSTITTRRCHRCGSIEDFDTAGELQHTCRCCGVRWDQDLNACRNLLSGQL